VFDNFEDVYKYYVVVAQLIERIFCPKKILKTDAYNESVESMEPIASIFSGDVVILELYSDILENAKRRLGDKIRWFLGDIRVLLDEKFDVIVDFSTIDHVSPEDMKVVVSNYKNMLNDSGVLSVIVWTSNKNIGEYVENDCYNQFIVDRSYFEKLLDNNFDIWFAKELIFAPPHEKITELCTLVHYLCLSKKGKLYV